jgi:HTH-type transcriptional regulator/antitoxin HigA
MKKSWKVLKNEADYQEAISQLDLVIDAEMGTDEGDELELLALLIKDYEDQRYPIKLPDPIDMIKLRMAEMGLKNKDMIEIIGSESHVSSVLSRKRQITLEMARKLSKKLNIRASIFINDDVPFEHYENEIAGIQPFDDPLANTVGEYPAKKLIAEVSVLKSEIGILNTQVKNLQARMKRYPEKKTV